MIIWLCLCCAYVSGAILTVGAGLAAALSAGLMYLETQQCTSFECCNDRWIPANQTLLRELLNERLYGQPFATKILTNSIVNHFREGDPPKPLVLMLHGPTGVGKNYLANILAESMFRKGKSSRYINYFSSSYHYQDSDKLKSHKENLQTAIRTNSTICDRQLYIFDEARRFPPKLLDSLATFLDPGSPHSKPLRRSIFLFLYEGDEPVVDWALEMWQKRQHREDLSLRDAEEKILPYVNSDQSLKDSLLISKALIDHHLPFLPLERNHVRRCIKNAIQDHLEKQDDSSKWKNVPEDELMSYVEEIEDDIIFYPEEAPVFSLYGCKKVTAKVRARLLDDDE